MLPCFEFKTAVETGLLREGRMYYPTPPRVTLSRTFPTALESGGSIPLQASAVFEYWSDIKRVVDLGRYRNSQSYQKAMFVGSWIIAWMEAGHAMLEDAAGILRGAKKAHEDGMECHLSDKKIGRLIARVKVAYLQLAALDTYETRMLEDLRTRLSQEKPGQVLFDAINKSIDDSWDEWRSHFQELGVTEASYVFVFDPDDPAEPEWDTFGKVSVPGGMHDAELVTRWNSNRLPVF
ncbi:hypothetical protein B0H21DRAFT_820394 [Amylocystis lapponica]|nr:hypothetical protein B0H21DRAFT_820394 [Amylocystis lapponica]